MDTTGTSGVFAREVDEIGRAVEVGFAGGRVISVSFPTTAPADAAADHDLLDRIEAYLAGGETRSTASPPGSRCRPTAGRSSKRSKTIPYGEEVSVSRLTGLAALDADDPDDLELVTDALRENPIPILFPTTACRAGRTPRRARFGRSFGASKGCSGLAGGQCVATPDRVPRCSPRRRSSVRRSSRRDPRRRRHSRPARSRDRGSPSSPTRDGRGRDRHLRVRRRSWYKVTTSCERRVDRERVVRDLGVADDDQGGPLDVVVAEHALDHLIESGDADRLEVGEFVFDLYERDRVVEGHVEGRVERPRRQSARAIRPLCRSWRRFRGAGKMIRAAQPLPLPRTERTPCRTRRTYRSDPPVTDHDRTQPSGLRRHRIPRVRRWGGGDLWRPRWHPRDRRRGASVVTETYEAENVAENPQIRYLIDPEEQLELIERVGRRTRRSWVLPLAPDRADPPERDGRRAGDVARPLVRHLRARRLPVRRLVALAWGRRRV